MQQVQTFQAQKTPTLLPQSTSRRLSILRQSVEGDFGKLTITDDHAPTADERAFFANRKAQLDAILKPSTESAAFAEIVAMFAAMRSKTASEDELVAIMETYVKDVADLPFFALQKACARFRRGECGDGVWVPTQGELANEARRIMQEFNDERAAIWRVLSAKVVPSITPDRRERNIEGVRRIAAETAAALKASVPKNEALRNAVFPTADLRPKFKTDYELKREAEEWLKREDAKGPQSIPLSGALLRMMGLRNPEQEGGAP
jgi:hypothetical protein